MTNHITGHYDAVSLLAGEYEMILEKLFELEKLISNYDNKALEQEINIKFSGQLNFVYEHAVRYFRMEEEIIFPRLENVLPPHASPGAMKSEHNSIVKMLFVLREQLKEADVFTTQFPVLQAEIIKITADFQRLYHKKYDVMYRELYTFFDDNTLDKIYSELKEKIIKS